MAGGWADLPKNTKMMIMIGGGVFVLVVIVALVVGLSGSGSRGGGMAGGSVSGARANMQARMLERCKARQRNLAHCQCMARELPRRLKDADAAVLMRPRRAGQKRPSGLMGKMFRAGLGAAKACRHLNKKTR